MEAEPAWHQLLGKKAAESSQFPETGARGLRQRGPDCSPPSCRPGRSMWAGRQGTVSAAHPGLRKAIPKSPRAKHFCFPAPCPTPKSQELAARQGSGLGRQPRLTQAQGFHSRKEKLPLSTCRAGPTPCLCPQGELVTGPCPQLTSKQVEANCPRSQQQARTRSPPSCLTACLLSQSVHTSSPGRVVRPH